VFTASVTSYCTRGTTDTGTRTRRGTVAADPRILPFGSRIRLQGLPGPYNGTYVVADSGRAINGTDVDIFISDCREAKRFGRQRARLHVSRPAAPARGTHRN
jgi:3D (Asp-Asp-Asp) domain-containing protein